MKDYIILGCYVLLSLISLLVGLLKKAKVVSKDTIFEQLLVRLPVLIIQAEKSMKSGEAKKESVIFYAVQWLMSMTGKDEAEVKSIYLDRISSAIEDILSTPKKKEVENE